MIDQNLPDEMLRDVARNPSAPLENRLECVRVLIERASRYIEHPELSAMAEKVLREAAEAATEVLSIVETVPVPAQGKTVVLNRPTVPAGPQERAHTTPVFVTGLSVRPPAPPAEPTKEKKS